MLISGHVAVGVVLTPEAVPVIVEASRVLHLVAGDDSSDTDGVH